MRKIYQTLLVIFVVIASSLSSGYAQNDERCGTQKWLENEFNAHPELRLQYEQREKALGEAITQRLLNGSSSSFIGNITVPIVFHVVGNAALQASITDAKILAQLNTLNVDYSGMNADSSNLPPEFQAVRGHGRVTFAFAQRTPAGGATTGINRITASTTSCGTSCTNDPVKYTSLGGADAWDPTKYVNVWLCSFGTGSNLLGYATFPIGTAEGGNPPITRQGVVVLAETVPGGTAAPYNLGRTLTHELGHFFWLRHITGDSPCGNDFPNTPGIDDTPQQLDLTGGCPGMAPNVVIRASGCGASPNPPGRMYQNYMDYTSDACMTMFTNGQNLRSEMAIDIYRPGLINSDGATPPSGFTFTAPAAVTTACGGSTTVGSTLATVSNGGYIVPINLTATSGVPAGTNVTFAPASVVPGNSSVVTLNNVNTLTPGTYNITITGISGANTQTQVVSFIVSPGTAPTVSAPANSAVCAGLTTSFTVTSSGTPTGYQWQVSTAAVPAFTNIPGATSATYNTPALTAADNGNQYRAVVTTQCATGTSAAATLTVQLAPSITTQPQAQTACAGTNTSFTVVAAGAGLSYQWQVSTTAVPAFTDIAGATSATVPVNAVVNAQNGDQYRVVITGTCAPALTSAAATLTVGDAASIGTQPVSQVKCVGENVTFTVSATGTNLTYQWQVSTVAVPAFTAIAGATSASYTITGVTAAQNGNQYRVVVFSCTPTGVNSDAVTLTVNTPVSITTQPVASTVCSGTNTSFTVAAAGTGLSYQWQYSPTCAGTWTNVTGATSATLSFTGVTVPSAGAYRVVVGGACGPLTSACVLLTVNTPVVITTQPTAFSICLPATTATFNVAATGTGLTYQWQVSTAAVPAFTNITGATAATLNITPLAANLNGNKYRVVLGGTCTPSLISDEVTLTVNSPVAITTQPQSTAKCTGETATFSVVATGSTITYQWQASVNGGVYFNLANGAPYSGVATNTLTVTNVAALQNNVSYRVIVSGVPCGAVASSVAVLTVNQTPTVVLNLGSYSNITPYVRTTLTPVVSPAGTYNYAWYRNNSLVPGVNSAVLPVSVDNFGGHYVVVTNPVTGCTAKSNDVLLADSASNLLFVYPNPTSGKFEVRYFNRGGGSQTRTLSIYDSKGAKVFTKQYALSGVYAKMEADLSGYGSGIYFIDLSDANGKRLATGRVSIRR